MEIQIKTFKEFQLEELYQVLQLRTEVFVVEQDCVYQDLDGLDQKAIHVLGKKNGKIVAYTRIFKAGDYFKNPSIGRVVVKNEERKYGYGKIIMNASIDYIQSYYNAASIELSAQSYLIRFYEDLGFVSTGEEYLEDGIPHVRMLCKLKS
ncbi:MAG: GNAT family N-acetyltransferase [Croceitalea sp.]|nr:GNAT family N-acetyltransferase [Croceitalea sp.]MBT8237438.1 GNAT family N-acetyltransferase [Croceitalea sp.]NNC33327.1 GNAT family N-acetyltransferase [Croceitalea sp.]NNL09279.1 GNAT family N-acetyltransferase [Croceitalea sp.]NNM17363.1 GNAT family N-acetyltransferase [Croceitalea sp.]